MTAQPIAIPLRATGRGGYLRFIGPFVMTVAAAGIYGLHVTARTAAPRSVTGVALVIYPLTIARADLKGRPTTHSMLLPPRRRATQISSDGHCHAHSGGMSA